MTGATPAGPIVNAWLLSDWQRVGCLGCRRCHPESVVTFWTRSGRGIFSSASNFPNGSAMLQTAWRSGTPAAALVDRPEPDFSMGYCYTLASKNETESDSSAYCGRRFQPARLPENGGG